MEFINLSLIFVTVAWKMAVSMHCQNEAVNLLDGFGFHLWTFNYHLIKRLIIKSLLNYFWGPC